MVGLEAISAHNGWAMSVLGISIVFAGLLLLSFAVSQIHKALEFWDNCYQRIKKLRQGKNRQNAVTPDLTLPDDIKESARQFKLLIERIGEPFLLPKLLDFSEKRGLLHPHSSINNLLQVKLIIPDGTGHFLWNHEVERNIQKRSRV